MLAKSAQKCAHTRSALAIFILLHKTAYMNNAHTYAHTKCVLQANLPRIQMVYVFRTGMNSTFTWAMLNKSISVLPIT